MVDETWAILIVLLLIGAGVSGVAAIIQNDQPAFRDGVSVYYPANNSSEIERVYLTTMGDREQPSVDCLRLHNDTYETVSTAEVETLPGGGHAHVATFNESVRCDDLGVASENTPSMIVVEYPNETTAFETRVMEG